MVWPYQWGLFRRIASYTRCSWAMLSSLLTVSFLSSISQCAMPSQSHQMQIMVFLGWRSGLTLSFGISRGATHSFLCFIFIYRHHFSFSVTIWYKKLFVIACCSMVSEILRSNLKAIFFVVFTKLMRHPDSQFFSKILLNEDDWESFFDRSLFFWPIHDLYGNFSPSKVL